MTRSPSTALKAALLRDCIRLEPAVTRRGRVLSDERALAHAERIAHDIVRAFRRVFVMRETITINGCRLCHSQLCSTCADKSSPFSRPLWLGRCSSPLARRLIAAREKQVPYCADVTDCSGQFPRLTVAIWSRLWKSDPRRITSRFDVKFRNKRRVSPPRECSFIHARFRRRSCDVESANPVRSAHARRSNLTDDGGALKFSR
jgi:hypothetical protein